MNTRLRNQGREPARLRRRPDRRACTGPSACVHRGQTPDEAQGFLERSHNASPPGAVPRQMAHTPARANTPPKPSEYGPVPDDQSHDQQHHSVVVRAACLWLRHFHGEQRLRPCKRKSGLPPITHQAVRKRVCRLRSAASPDRVLIRRLPPSRAARAPRAQCPNQWLRTRSSAPSSRSERMPTLSRRSRSSSPGRTANA